MLASGRPGVNTRLRGIPQDSAEVDDMTTGRLGALGADASVACIGETMALLVPRDAGPLDYDRCLAVSVAGAESNVAMYLADLGHRARWISRLGNDALGQVVLDYIAMAGVDVSAVDRDPERPTGLFIKEPRPEGTRVHYYRRGSAATALDRTVLHHERVRTADLLHLSGITPALSDSCRDLIVAAVEEGRRAGRLISFDVNWRPSLWRSDPSSLLLELARGASIVFVGSDEGADLWGYSSPKDVRGLIPEPVILVVKDGGVGTTVFVDGDQYFVPALDVEVVEPVGAGDAFAAGYLAGLLRGFDVTGQVRLGHLTAAAALRVTGDHGPLLAPDVQLRLLRADNTDWATARIESTSHTTVKHTAGGQYCVPDC